MLLFTLITFLSATLAASHQHLSRQIDDPIDASRTPWSHGTHNGFHYAFFTEARGPLTYQNLDAGRYRVEWGKDCAAFTAGKGWAGRDLPSTVNYNGTWTTTDGHLGLYGWSDSPLVEFYIIENWGLYDPGQDREKMGEVESDGSVYDVYRWRASEKAYWKYFSVRRGKRTGGRIEVTKHFDRWNELGMTMGKLEYFILATEAVSYVETRPGWGGIWRDIDGGVAEVEVWRG
ncbi:hypothetical protein OQA88_2170 [Cercophora sp. LCS_1]